MLFTHQKNIERLLRKEEKKANLPKLKKKNRQKKEPARPAGGEKESALIL